MPEGLLTTRKILIFIDNIQGEIFRNDQIFLAEIHIHGNHIAWTDAVIGPGPLAVHFDSVLPFKPRSQSLGQIKPILQNIAKNSVLVFGGRGVGKQCIFQ